MQFSKEGCLDYMAETPAPPHGRAGVGEQAWDGTERPVREGREKCAAGSSQQPGCQGPFAECLE